jgi:hypothetical protein
MLKTIGVVFTAFVVTASPLAYAQAPSERGLERLSEADLAQLTDARVNVVKAALELTADQEKLWPAIEDAIRARAKDLSQDQKRRLAHLAIVTLREMRNPTERRRILSEEDEDEL